MDNYLDTKKSVIISSPAGSGKTEKLARRYIALLKEGVDVERILAITFTDKAAAEMKQRILRILKEEDERLFNRLLDKMALMRVSTIHSFCGTLLRRFSFEAAIDPNYRVEDSIDSRIAWEEILYEVLREAGTEGGREHEFLLQVLGERGFRGLDHLRAAMEHLFDKGPFSLEANIPEDTLSVDPGLIEELKAWPGAVQAIDGYEELFGEDALKRLISLEDYFLTGSKMPRRRQPAHLREIVDYQGWTLKMYTYWRARKAEEHRKRTERIREIFRKCWDRYTQRKRDRGVLDFSDLEYIACRMLTEDPEWANILYAFDEKTDHILVDEFQDTNIFQWRIIDKLTEEWRSGLGAKRQEGIKPTIFLVGDEKQSIYFFRGANVEIFHRAKEKLRRWLGEEFHYEEARENFRSCQAIVEFTNYVFSRIMDAEKDSPPWVTRYSPFTACRTDASSNGMVEFIILDETEEGMAKAKENEADVLARRIQALAGNHIITDRHTQQQRPCRYMDMAILLRRRRHLRKYEEALRRHNIPFVAVKGIGFYQEPEVAMLRALVYFLSNPKDDYSLYILLKSPLFMIEEASIIRAMDGDGDCLFSKLRGISTHSEGAKGLGQALRFLEDWLSQLPQGPLAELIERALVETGAWRHFHEPQRRANIRKFIRLVEDLESSGKSLFKIRDFLERTQDREEEPKANVNIEGMDAVRIMTIHAAKGLEFPIVFLPGLEEPFIARTKEAIVYEREGRLLMRLEPDPAIRRNDEDFILQIQKEREEQKRLLYVAVTRAEEALILISPWSEKGDSFWAFLRDALAIQKNDTSCTMEADIQGLSLLTEDDVHRLYETAKRPEVTKPELSRYRFIPLSIKERKPWRAVTEVVDIRRRHGEDWMILGEVMHRIFEALSKGLLEEKDIKTRVEMLLEARGIVKEQKERLWEVVEKDISLLKERGLWQDIILSRKDSFSELPFVLESRETVYTGRIDRIIKDGDIYKVYDYKTFPVKEEEIEYLLKEYSFQMNLYKRAVMRIFNTEKVRSFIVFTHRGEIREVLKR